MRQRRGWRQLVPGEGPLARVSPVVAFLVVAVVFAAGVVVGGVLGAVLLFALAALVGLLLAAAWPGLSGSERAMRAVVLLVVVAVAISALR